MTPEEIVDLIMPPAEQLEVVVEVFGGVAWVPRETPGVVVNIIYYTAEGERILHADEVGAAPATADVPTSSAVAAKSPEEEACPGATPAAPALTPSSGPYETEARS